MADDIQVTYIQDLPAAGDLSDSDLFLVHQSGNEKSLAYSSLFAKFPGRLLNIQTFTASGTYTPTAGTKKIMVTVLGGGGGGGGARGTTGSSLQSMGGGGGGGGYAKSLITTGFSSVLVTVGAGGAGGTATSATGNNGATGGNSSFGSLCTATGGTGGDGSAAVAPTSSSSPVRVLGRQGGVGTGNLISAYGGTGGDGSFFQWSIGTSTTYSGCGGDSFFGAGGYKWGSFDSDVNPFINGLTAGAGAAGGSNKTGTANGIAGGVGANGIVIIEEYA